MKPGDLVKAVSKTKDWYDFTIGKVYQIDDYYEEDGIAYVVITNDSDESDFHFLAKDFVKVS